MKSLSVLELGHQDQLATTKICTGLQIYYIPGLWQLAALLGLLIIAFEIRKPFSVAASLTFFQV